VKYKQINKQNIWAEKLTKKNFLNTPCLFLDRDGVINEQRIDHIKNIDEFKIFSGVGEAIKLLKANPELVKINAHVKADGYLRSLKEDAMVR